MKKQGISLRQNLSKILQEIIQKNDLFCSMLTIKVISIKKIILSFLRLPFLVACFNKKIDSFKMYAPKVSIMYVQINKTFLMAIQIFGFKDQ